MVMNKFDEKVEKMKNHLVEHTTDYQTVISLFKAESDSIAYEQRKEKQLKKKELAKYMKAGERDGE